MFIYGSTCNYLPFFFNKGDEAKTALKQVIKLLEKDYLKIDKEIVGYITKFLNEKIEMTEQEKKIVETATKVSSKNSVN
jgi:ribosomal protein S17E